MTRNKRFPRYIDDADYTTNAPSYYHDLGRKNKLLEKLAHKIWEYDERLDERLDDLQQVLSSYLAQWDDRIENLDKEVSHIFVTWLEDGTLEQIINHDVLGNKADKSFVDSEIERLDQKDENLTSQLAQTVKDLGERGVNVGNFPRLPGETDDTPRIKRAYDSAKNGDTLLFPTGEYYMASSVKIVKNISLEGVGLETRIIVEDVGFELGDISGGIDVTVATMSSVKNMLFTSPDGGLRGHIGRYYGGDLNPTFAFPSQTTEQAGFKKSTTENATNTAIKISQAYAPTVIEGCYFYEIGTGVDVGYHYGHVVRENRFFFCNVGVHVRGNTTTLSIRNNTIERCAIGVISQYPSHHITIIENVIEANYAGCDILFYNQPEEAHIKRNYFEASPRNIVLMGDGSISGRISPHKLYFEENYTMQLYIESHVQGLRLLNNNLIKIDFNLKVSHTMKNIYLFNNYQGSSREPFDLDNITYNSVARNFMNEVTVDATNDFIGGTSLYKRPDLRNHVQKEYGFTMDSSSSRSRGFVAIIPNEDSTCLIEVTSIKYKEGDFAPRKVVHNVMLKRIKDQSTKVQIDVGDEILFETLGAEDISIASQEPLYEVDGSISETQTVDLLIANTHTFNVFAQWILSAKVISNRTDIVLKEKI